MANIIIRLASGSIEGRVVDSTFTGAGVGLQVETSREVPVLAIGGKVETLLVPEVAETPLKLTARVMFQELRDETVRCGLAYPVEDLPAVRKMLYPRRAHRVQPSSVDPVRAWVPQDVRVLVNDISTGGVGLIVAEEDQLRFVNWKMKLTLELPDEAEPMEMVAQIRIRRLLGATVLHGVEFDEKETLDLASKQERIHRYVMKRQAEQLQERADRRPESR